MTFKKIISILISSALAFSMCCVPISAQESATAVKTAEQLMSMKSDGNYYLVADIDLWDVDWKPIYGFSGSFDGNGYEISGLDSDTYGLFASLKTGASVKNVKLTDVYITSKYKTVGAIAAVISSGEKNIVIENCYVSGLVASCRTKHNMNASSSTAGAIVGKNYSSSATVTGCYSNAVVASERIVGGIAGVNKGTIKDCGFGGQLGSSYNVYELVCDENGLKTDDYKYLYAVGGISGFNYGKISNSFVSGIIEVGKYYGAITGAMMGSGKISYCVNSADVPYDDFLTGGLIAGYASSKSTITNSYTKKPTNTTAQNDVGKGNSNTTTYGVSADKFGVISSFKRLDEDWTIYNGAPILKKLSDYASETPLWEIKGERLISTQGDSEDEEASVDYGYDNEGNILE